MPLMLDWPRPLKFNGLSFPENSFGMMSMGAAKAICSDNFISVLETARLAHKHAADPAMHDEFEASKDNFVGLPSVNQLVAMERYLRAANNLLPLVSRTPITSEEGLAKLQQRVALGREEMQAMWKECTPDPTTKRGTGQKSAASAGALPFVSDMGKCACFSRVGWHLLTPRTAL